MKRRDFFRFGFTRLQESVVRSIPEPIQPRIPETRRDLTVLSARPREAEEAVEDLVRAHFGERMLRLKQSVLPGEYRGGIVLFEGNAFSDFRDGISLLTVSLRQLAADLALDRPQSDPTLLRYTNYTPPYSRSVEIFYRDRLLLALPLAEPGRFTFEGALGTLTFEIRDGLFSVVDAPCPRRICVAHPPILTPGQRITCVPNRVTAVIGAPLG